MTPKERVLGCLRGEECDLVPVTLYEGFVPYCGDIASLLKRGLCIIYRHGAYRTECEGLETKTTSFIQNGEQLIRTDYITPDGSLYTVKKPCIGTTWTVEHLFKNRDDYRVLKYIYSHKSYTADYTIMERAIKESGDNGLVRAQLPLEPLQEFISSDIMDCATFALEWYDNRDMLEELFRINAEKHEELYRITAKSPATHCNYGGNVIPQLIGPKVFEKYYIPYYNRAAEILHSGSILTGTHLDGDNTPLLGLLGKGLDLDYIEAYDPSISPGVSVARECIGDKALWINWPSGEHFRSGTAAAEITENLCGEWGQNRRFLVGVTEDMPHGRWDELLNGILNGLGYPG